MGIDEQEMIDFPESGIERAIKKMVGLLSLPKEII